MVKVTPKIGMAMYELLNLQMKLPITGKLFAKVPEDDRKVLKKPNYWELCASGEWMITTWLRVDYNVTIGVEWDVNKLYDWPRFSSMAQAFNHVKVGDVVITGLEIKKWESPGIFMFISEI